MIEDLDPDMQQIGIVLGCMEVIIDQEIKDDSTKHILSGYIKELWETLNRMELRRIK